MKESIKHILEETKAGLQPPTQSEVDRAMAKWLFGERAEKMLQYAPWSFALLKLLWKKGEEPWQN